MSEIAPSRKAFSPAVDKGAGERDIRDRTCRVFASRDAAGASGAEVAAEDPLTRFKAQYEALPSGNILAQGSTWKAVQARLSQPANAVQLRKVTQELQGGGRLYAVMEDGSLEFVDDNSETPPLFVKDNGTS